MRYIELPTNYYMDPRVEGLSAGAETLLLRCLVHAGNTESDGVLHPSAFKFLGVHSVDRRRAELIEHGLLEPLEDGTYVLRFGA